MTTSEAFALYQKADKAWQASLVAAYGSDAGDARYQVRGSMVEGYAECVAAHDAWHDALAAERAIRKLTPADRDDARAVS